MVAEIGIPSPLQNDDGILLTPQQRQERHQSKVAAFVEGMKKLEEETGMGLRVFLQYTPEGIFPGGRIVELKPGQSATPAVPTPPPVEPNEPKK